MSIRRLCILFIFILVILIESISFATYTTALLQEDDKRNIIEKEENFLTEEEQETLDFINAYRKENGLKELKPFSKLQTIAEKKGKDIVQNGYFSHISPTLGTPFEMLAQNEVDYGIAGENLAGNTTPKKAVEAWIHSKSHRENILEEKFEYTGICVVESEVYGKVFVQLFIQLKNS